MQVKEVSQRDHKNRLWVAVLAPGEEVKQALLDFAGRENIPAASFVALGAFSTRNHRVFRMGAKEIQADTHRAASRVIALAGDVVRNEKNEPDLHAHTVLGLPDGTTRGGHLLEGYVRPTLEVTITETPGYLIRRKRADLGIALIDVG